TNDPSRVPGALPVNPVRARAPRPARGPIARKRRSSGRVRPAAGQSSPGAAKPTVAAKPTEATATAGPLTRGAPAAPATRTGAIQGPARGPIAAPEAVKRVPRPAGVLGRAGATRAAPGAPVRGAAARAPSASGPAPSAQ